MKSAHHSHTITSKLTQRLWSQASYARLLSMLGSVMVLTAASMSANATSLINDTEYLDYQPPNNIQETCNARDNCPQIEIKYLNSNHDWINNIVNARIDHLIINSKPTESVSVDVKASQVDAKMAIDDFVSSQFNDLPEDSVFVYSLMVTPDYIGHVQDFELFEISAYVFTGGAHGMPYSEYLIFDQTTKAQIKLADILKNGQEKRFEALAYDAYKVWVKSVSDDVNSYEESWPFTLSDNITLTDKGVDIRYQHYSIGPYAYGMPVLSIPYNKLNGVIKPRYSAK